MAEPIKRDPSGLPLFMEGDERRRNKNIDSGKPLCNRCDGTGNALFTMYRACEDCDGTGIAPPTKKKGTK